ncbi:pteridine reductase [Thiorhodospira sibirica]|uniref:pteridine reductase n=1 Tax=Thiorhodospira sibirica TaxID=154347 RepID=UPI00022C1758|nr:pteridine reductase [Thiorhodospira sibirica]
MTPPQRFVKTVLITGGARRIGAQISRYLHHAGLNIALHYRGSAAAAEALAVELNAQRPDSVAIFRADLCALNELHALAAAVVQHFGGVDVLINNASTFYPTRLGEISSAHWEDLLGTNLKAPLFLAQALAPVLAQRHGCIVNIVDIHALKPLKDYAVYSIAKAGLWTLTKALARELGPQVRVNGVAPGAILWPEADENTASHAEMIQQTLLKREGSPQDIARTVSFLIHDADYITGQIIPVDGGRSV